MTSRAKKDELAHAETVAALDLSGILEDVRRPVGSLAAHMKALRD